jgi:hypothetical protein
MPSKAQGITALPLLAAGAITGGTLLSVAWVAFKAADLLGGLELFESILVAPLQGTDQAVLLAGVIARTGLDPWDAHVAGVADAAVCPILTLDAAKWRQHSADLDEPLHIIEIADPGE